MNVFMTGATGYIGGTCSTTATSCAGSYAMPRRAAGSRPSARSR